MKDLIRKILRETFEEKSNPPKTITHDEGLTYFNNILNDIQSKHGDVISNYLKMKMDLDKAKYLQNIQYKLYANARGPYEKYYEAQVKFPFGNGKKKFFTIHIGNLTQIDSLSPEDKDKFIRDKINSYLLKKFPLNFPI